ncbi:hypothetical protein C9439_06205 [archaeon SCG-AAA382B04]|nr:hypothetical protein C9439_06205 [archaeon SCG-AAA382B04]
MKHEKILVNLKAIESRALKLSKNNKGQISIDFLTAISIFLITFFFVIYSLSGAAITYRTQETTYPAAERLSNLLVKNPGLKKNIDTGWEEWWHKNSSKIARIGLSTHLEDKLPKNYTTNDTPAHYVLSFHKVDGKYNSNLDTEGLLKRHGNNTSTYWWSFGEATNETEYNSYKRAMDLSPKYNTYIQIRPLNTTLSMSFPNQEARTALPDKKTIEKVEKIVYIKRYSPLTLFLLFVL